MSGDIAAEIFEGESFTAFDHGASRQRVARCDVIESLKNERPVGVLCAFGRWLTKSDRDAIGASWNGVCRVKARARRDVQRAFGFCCVCEFMGDRMNFRCAERSRFLASNGERNESEDRGEGQRKTASVPAHEYFTAHERRDHARYSRQRRREIEMS